MEFRSTYGDPLLEEPATVRGVVRQEITSPLWDPLTELGRNLGAPPYGNNLLPFVLGLDAVSGMPAH